MPGVDVSCLVQIQPVSGSPSAWSHPRILGKRQGSTLLWLRVRLAGRVWLFPKALPPVVLLPCTGVTALLCSSASLHRDASPGASHAGAVLPRGRSCLPPRSWQGRAVRQPAPVTFGGQPWGRMALALAKLSSRRKQGWAVGKEAQRFSLWTGFIPACRGPGVRDWHVEPQHVGSWH